LQTLIKSTVSPAGESTIQVYNLHMANRVAEILSDSYEKLIHNSPFPRGYVANLPVEFSTKAMTQRTVEMNNDLFVETGCALLVAPFIYFNILPTVATMIEISSNVPSPQIQRWILNTWEFSFNNQLWILPAAIVGGFVGMVHYGSKRS